MSEYSPYRRPSFPVPEKQEKLDGCVEKLCQRFGKRCIRNAVLLQELGMPMGNVEITVPTGLVK